MSKNGAKEGGGEVTAPSVLALYSWSSPPPSRCSADQSLGPSSSLPTQRREDDDQPTAGEAAASRAARWPNSAALTADGHSCTAQNPFDVVPRTGERSGAAGELSRLKLAKATAVTASARRVNVRGGVADDGDAEPRAPASATPRPRDDQGAGDTEPGTGKLQLRARSLGRGDLLVPASAKSGTRTSGRAGFETGVP